MATWQLPTWAECSDTDRDTRDPLQDFIFEQTPSGDAEELSFRESLWKAIMTAHDSITAFQASEGVAK